MQENEQDENIIRRQIFNVLNTDQPSIKLIKAFAGDITLADSEKASLERLKRQYGRRIYAKILFELTHLRYAENDARHQWHQIMKHKHALAQALGRDVGIIVATLDFMLNIQGRLKYPKIIDTPQMTKVAEMAVKDGLTDLYDDATFKLKLNSEIERYERYGSAFSILMLDIDDFKKLNDTYGHPEGDRVLRQLAGLMEESTRDLDLCFRYGGEEFAIILPQTNRTKARNLAERIRQRVRRDINGKIKLSVSIGTATCPDDATSAEALIQKADQALYQAKKSGKNRVCQA